MQSPSSIFLCKVRMSRMLRKHLVEHAGGALDVVRQQMIDHAAQPLGEGYESRNLLPSKRGKRRRIEGEDARDDVAMTLGTWRQLVYES